MRTLAPMSALILAASLACVAPTPTPTLAELNSRWVGQPWKAYLAANGAPQSLSALPDGGQAAMYHHSRTEAGPRPTREVVNVSTGERSILTPGANADTARQQWGPTAQTRVVDGKATGFSFTCTTVVRVNARGLIDKIERTGNDC